METILNTPNGIDAKSPFIQKILTNLQGNILKSHGRNHVKILFIDFIGEEADIKLWISKLEITSAFKQRATKETRKIIKDHDGGVFMNFLLSATGYEELGFEDIKPLCNNGNDSFREGMKSAKVRRKLGDPSIEDWENGYKEQIDAAIIIADDDEKRLLNKIDEVKTSLIGLGDIVQEEDGVKLPGGIEHFGFKDGISDPIFFKDDIEETIKKGGIDKWDPVAPLDIILVKDPFVKDGNHSYGSFCVFRKLEQDVVGFEKKISILGEKLKLNNTQLQKNVTKEEFAGALAVGRFKDGTPLVLSDSPTGLNNSQNNFDYKEEDQKGLKCPFHSHIRKTNPRGQGILVPKRFIIRRGIPYGKQKDTNKKGLLFMCFQSSLRKQFNFMQKTWANKVRFPPFRDKTGIDPLIGQGNKGSQKWPESYNNKKEFDFDFGGFISMKGGEYFFAPSIDFLKNLASR
ncbi:Dyp-type peroxidase [Chondrinema litorale]|uniref:Dyp-type peroxidase n=1 Tax=Chondrinema litorale TaxID=2994555 RepID=UPI002542B6DF|nr:Dyp-type peroxidase [Chondrinema litorale]UZS00203.1 Dyp-type peroxidase [Chondrinema litorale]